MRDEKRRRPVARLLLATTSVLLTLLVIELFVRVVDAVSGRGFFSQHRNVMTKRFRRPIPFRTFGFAPYKDEGGQKMISSRHGELFAIDKPKGVFRIVAFGGSTTENKTSFRANGEHYPLVLQQELRGHYGVESIEVINVGSSGYATPHSLILLTLDVLSWDPDLVILSHNINDLTAAYWPGFAFDYSNKYSDPAFIGPDYAGIYSRANQLFGCFQVYWIVKEFIEGISGPAEYPIVREPHGDLDHAFVDTFERNLVSFVNLAKSRGIQVLLGAQALQPSKAMFERHMMYKPYNDVVVYPRHDEFVRHHAELNHAMERAARASGAGFLDSDALMGDDEALFTDYVHYSSEGVRKLGATYARFIIDQGWITP